MPLQAVQSSSEKFLGRWALSIGPNAAPGWLEVVENDGWYDGSILWIGGSVLPLSSVIMDGDQLTVTRVRDVERKDADGKVVKTQQLTEILRGHVDRDGVLRLTRRFPREDGTGFDVAEAVGKRIPPLPPRPDLSKVKFGKPINLFTGHDLEGWRAIPSDATNGWSAKEGVLVNATQPHKEGEPRKHYANLQTVPDFEDFNLKLEVNVPPEGNSGVYLRGLYEVQVFDSYGKDLDSHNMGAIYSRITPVKAAEKKAGSWQTLDMTLVNRHVTVVLNGATIIDNAPVYGCTGGALWSDESRPGPIYLQGDHGPVQYRDIVLRPVVGR